MATDASDYPTNADSIPRTNPSDNLTGHSDLHDKMADAIEEIQGFVGVSGDTTAGTVVKRVSDLEGTDIDITLTGDVTGSGTINNLGDVSITTTVGDDSHNHTIANVDDLQTTLDGKAASSHTHSYAATTHTHSYAATSHTHSYAATSHTHSYLPTSGGTLSGTLTLSRSGGNPVVLSNEVSHRGAPTSMIRFVDNGNDQDIRCGHAYIGAPGGGYGDCEVAGSVKVGGTVVHSSSRTIKNTIEDFGDATQTIDALRPVTFIYNKIPEMGTQIGLIAEEVESVDPRLVVDADVPSLNLNSVVGLAIAGLKEANARITALEARIAELGG